MLNLYKQVREAHRYLIIRTPGAFVPALNTSWAGWGILGWTIKMSVASPMWPVF